MPLEKADLDQIQEMLIAATEALTQKLGENSESLRQEFGQQIGGVKKWAKTAIAASSTEFEKKVAEAIAIETEEENQEAIAPESNASDGKTTEQPDGRIDQLFQQVKAQKQMVESLRSDLQKSEAARAQSEEIARKVSAKGKFASDIREKVVDPDTLISVLESKGLVFEKEGRYLAKTGKVTDDGNDEVVDASLVVDSLLTTDYSYFSKPRQGTGTGTQPTGNSGLGGKTYVKDDVSATQLLSLMESGQMENILNELD
jgi:hypothetical protein